MRRHKQGAGVRQYSCKRHPSIACLKLVFVSGGTNDKEGAYLHGCHLALTHRCPFRVCTHCGRRHCGASGERERLLGVLPCCGWHTRRGRSCRGCCVGCHCVRRTRVRVVSSECSRTHTLLRRVLASSPLWSERREPSAAIRFGKDIRGMRGLVAADAVDKPRA